jgi:hypothetical protein
VFLAEATILPALGAVLTRLFEHSLIRIIERPAQMQLPSNGHRDCFAFT